MLGPGPSGRHPRTAGFNHRSTGVALTKTISAARVKRVIVLSYPL